MAAWCIYCGTILTSFYECCGSAVVGGEGKKGQIRSCTSLGDKSFPHGPRSQHSKWPFFFCSSCQVLFFFLSFSLSVLFINYKLNTQADHRALTTGIHFAPWENSLSRKEHSNLNGSVMCLYFVLQQFVLIIYWHYCACFFNTFMWYFCFSGYLFYSNLL